VRCLSRLHFVFQVRLYNTLCQYQLSRTCPIQHNNRRLSLWVFTKIFQRVKWSRYTDESKTSTVACKQNYAKLQWHISSIKQCTLQFSWDPKGRGFDSHRGQANFSDCSVWMHTQSNITNIIFTWVHNTNTQRNHHICWI
jgi:hypothetical protein